MNINFGKLDMQIDYLMHLQTIAKEKFGKLVQACTVKAFDTRNYAGVVELKDGRVYTVKAVKENPKDFTCKWRKVK